MLRTIIIFCSWHMGNPMMNTKIDSVKQFTSLSKTSSRRTIDCLNMVSFQTNCNWIGRLTVSLMKQLPCSLYHLLPIQIHGVKILCHHKQINSVFWRSIDRHSSQTICHHCHHRHHLHYCFHYHCLHQCHYHHHCHRCQRHHLCHIHWPMHLMHHVWSLSFHKIVPHSHIQQHH